MGEPYLPDVGVLALVQEVFDRPWQPRHQILTRLSHYYPVVWVVPAREWREIFRAPERYAGGKLMRHRAYKSHILEKKSRKRKRRLRSVTEVSPADAGVVRRMLSGIK